jgi:hypothetical protein
MQYQILPYKKYHLVVLALLLMTGLLPTQSRADTPNDVRAGMSIEDATRVAIRCIQAASRMKTRDIRLQDTLNFVGINDEMRVDALRRHIVRNPNIGVPSVTGTLGATKFYYLILNDQLADIDTKSTVAKLAQTIAAKAGLPRMSYSRVAQMISLCRKSATNISAAAIVKDDQGLPSNFAACLAGTKAADGTVVSAAVTDPTGHEYRYWIKQAQVDALITAGKSYAALSKELGDTVCASRRPDTQCLEAAEATRIQQTLQEQSKKRQSRR